MATQTSWACEALAVNPNSAADRRLRNEWLFGSASHMFSLVHFAKILQLLQFHRVLLTSIRCAGSIVLMNSFYWTRRTAGPIVKSVEAVVSI